MKAYHVDAANRIIRPFEYHGYEDFRRLLPGGITIGAIFEGGDVLYVDDEALLGPAKVAFRIRRRPDGQPMMSDAILTGRDDLDTTLPPTMTLSELEREIEWLDLETAIAWFRERASDPAVIGNGTVLARWADLLKNLEGERGFRPSDLFL